VIVCSKLLLLFDEEEFVLEDSLLDTFEHDEEEDAF